MPNFKTLEPVNDPVFQVAWESTLKCNLDCSYCGDGHDNSKAHPSLQDSLKTVDFICEYVNEIMLTKPSHLQNANINIQGGESLFHPNITEILSYIQEKKASVRFNLTVGMITNAIAGTKKWRDVVNLVDYFTISYHPEMLSKQELMFRLNCNYAKMQNKNFHVSIMMHPKEIYWQKCLRIIEFCKNKNIKYVVRQIDHHWLDRRFNYNESQVEFLTGKKPASLQKKIKAIFSNGFDLDSTGRACCGGNSLCTNSCNTTNYVEGNNFKGWHCSVAENFLYVKQETGEVFTNKDCKMNFAGKVGPIGNLKNTKSIIDSLKTRQPYIICKKTKCWCGLCAPKAETKELFESINSKYATAAEFLEKTQ